MVSNLGIHQRFGDHADHLPISGQHCIGDRAHQTNLGGAVHQPHTAAGHGAAQCRGGLTMLRRVARSGSAVDREASHRLPVPEASHSRPWCSSRPQQSPRPEILGPVRALP